MKKENKINCTIQKMTDYGRLDDNKFNTIVITFVFGIRVFYTTFSIRVVTFHFCVNIFQK